MSTQAPDAGGTAMSSPSTMNRRLSASLALLLLPALGYLGIGFFALVIENKFSYPIDLRLPWSQQALVLQGKDPQVHGHPDPGLPASHAVLFDKGSGYPPWSYFTMMFFIPPTPWIVTKVYFAIVNLAALVGIGWYAYERLKPYGRLDAAAGTVALFAMFPIAICVSYGQTAVIITALVCLGMWLISSKRPMSGGVLLGASLLKPHLAGLCMLPVLYRGHFRAIAASVTYVVLASVIVGLWIGREPVGMFLQASGEASGFFHMSHNHLIQLFSEWLGFRAGMLALAASGVLVVTICFWFMRSETDLLPHLAVCATVAMFWSYRKHYDFPLMILPMLCLWRDWLRQGPPLSLAGFLLLGSFLWLPLRDAQWEPAVMQWWRGFACTVGVLAIIKAARAASNAGASETAETRRRPRRRTR